MKTEKQTKKPNLLIGFTVLIAIISLLTAIGLFALRPAPLVLQGEAEASQTRISGKVPGRILEICVSEGQAVQKGDTLVIIESPEVEAKLQQAVAAQQAAESQSRKAILGTRQEQIAGAYEIWQKALTGSELAKKSYDRVQNLYDKNVMPAQKRDEAEANYKAALATARAAKSQYDMALNGAQNEDKEAAQAMVERAKGAVAEVNSYIHETTLLAPASGEVSDIFPGEGELVGTGAPILIITKMDEQWVTFNIPEALLSKITMGKKLMVKIPALGGKEVEVEVGYIKAMANYATWKATKTSGGYDAKTFEVRAYPITVVEGLRPGMTVLLEWKSIK